MSIHIGAKSGEIAEYVLLPGDPVRARYIAENFLEDVHCYTEIRGMLGFTGSYNGMRISVQGGGMGLPSNAIYLHELIHEYGVKKVIRVGTCGAIVDHLPLGSVILPIGASTDSNINRARFNGFDYAPVADLELLNTAKNVSEAMGVTPNIGGIFSTDIFYSGNSDRWKIWAEHGIIATEMESSVIFTMAAQFNIQALSVLSVSDIIPTEVHQTNEQKKESTLTISKIALETLKSL